jgi:pilus assembly protein Flp/PilA
MIGPRDAAEGHSAHFPQIAKADSAPRRGKYSREGKTMKTFIKMLKDDSGASAAEYALILAIVGSAIALAALYLGGTISTAINSAADCINDPQNACQ